MSLRLSDAQKQQCQLVCDTPQVTQAVLTQHSPNRAVIAVTNILASARIHPGCWCLLNVKRYCGQAS